jgi:transcriptional regulator
MVTINVERLIERAIETMSIVDVIVLPISVTIIYGNFFDNLN